MFENNGYALSELVLPIFATQKKHRVLFLSKANYIRNLVNNRTSHDPIISFTVNAFPVSKRWEKAPSPRKRLTAAKKLSEIGYEIRLRIDPIVPIKNWQVSYKSLIDKIFEKFTPERITAGSPRGLQSTINNCKDTSWTKYLSERSNWGKKLDSDTRFKIYSILFNYLKENHNFKNVAMCKETIEMWNRLGMDYRKIRCNCI